jgi:predicted AAA+ superfamily ATPase
LALLEATFIFQPLLAWSASIGQRFVKSSKIHLLESGLAAHLRGVVHYLGEQRLRFADNLWTLSISALWESA